MVTYAGPLVLVLVGLSGLVFIFGRRAGQLRAALQELPQPVGDTASIRAPRVFITLLRTLSRRVGRGAFSLLGVFRVVGRAIATFLRRPPVSLRVPRLAWRSTPRGMPLGPRWPTAPRRRDEPRVPPAPVVEPLVPAPPAVPVHLVVDEVPSPEPVREATSAVPDGESEPLSPVPVREAVVSAEGTESAEPIPEPTVGQGTGSAPALEPHVDERRPGRRKVVGHVRTVRAVRTRPRREGQTVVLPTPELVGMARAAALIEAGDLLRAEELLVTHLSEQPRDVEGYRLLAALYLRRGDSAQAREVCEEALRRDPGATALYGPLGQAYAHLGRYGQALQVFQRAHDADESNLQYLEALLAIAARMDRRPLVRVTAEKILQLQSDHAEAKKHLAKVAAGA